MYSFTGSASEENFVENQTWPNLLKSPNVTLIKASPNVFSGDCMPKEVKVTNNKYI